VKTFPWQSDPRRVDLTATAQETDAATRALAAERLLGKRTASRISHELDGLKLSSSAEYQRVVLAALRLRRSKLDCRA